MWRKSALTRGWWDWMVLLFCESPCSILQSWTHSYHMSQLPNTWAHVPEEQKLMFSQKPVYNTHNSSMCSGPHQETSSVSLEVIKLLCDRASLSLTRRNTLGWVSLGDWGRSIKELRPSLVYIERCCINNKQTKENTSSKRMGWEFGEMVELVMDLCDLVISIGKDLGEFKGTCL